MPYAGQRAILTTMHGKERVIARPLAVATGLTLDVTRDIDTDHLGTFAGERPRAADARTTALAKARLGIAATGVPIGVASEGSFAPHPVVPFVTADYELLAFVDTVRGFELVETVITAETNSAQCTAGEGAALDRWLAQVRFPSHAVLVRPRVAPPGVGVIKGITARASLEAAVAAARAASADGEAILETDMRAHCNPLRRRAIGRAATQLARRLACCCPRCAQPGFGRVDTVGGLPCAWCGTPTALVLEERWGCVGCPHVEARGRADGQTTADPASCPQCNP